MNFKNKLIKKLNEIDKSLDDIDYISFYDQDCKEILELDKEEFFNIDDKLIYCKNFDFKDPVKVTPTLTESLTIVFKGGISWLKVVKHFCDLEFVYIEIPTRPKNKTKDICKIIECKEDINFKYDDEEDKGYEFTYTIHFKTKPIV